MDREPRVESFLEEPPGGRIATALAKLAVALRQQSSQRPADGMTPTQGRILVRLLSHPGATLQETAIDLGIRPAAATEAVGVLESKGCVARTRDGERSGRVALSLTPFGRRRAQEAASWPGFLAEVTATLSPRDQGQLLRSLMLVMRALEERGQIAGSRMCVSCDHFRPHDYPHRPGTHHCTLLDIPFDDSHLRIECPDHRPASAAQAAETWRRFAGEGGRSGGGPGDRNTDGVAASGRRRR
jgi:DNA-binding MarR family transcriptional regulator